MHNSVIDMDGTNTDQGKLLLSGNGQNVTIKAS